MLDPDSPIPGDLYHGTHPNCYDDETCVQTSNDMKLFKDIDKDDEIMSINPYDLRIEWLKPLQHISYHYKGKMIHFSNSQIDLMVTPEHHCFAAVAVFVAIFLWIFYPSKIDQPYQLFYP